MQGLVYIFIAIIGLAIGMATYFALAFTPVEAALAALISIGLSLFFLERGLRRRAEDRLERMIQDLSRLLSTDAKAGQTLSARINELYDMEADKRLGVLEADVSVLGTVLRQLAETMAEMEDAQARLDNQQGAAGAPPVAEGLNVVEPARDIEPVIPLEMLRKALDDERLIHHIEPIITLPQRRVHGYDLVPRLMLEDGELAMPADFMPVSGGNELISQIEALALHDAITIARRTRTAGEPVVIYVPLSLATLHNAQGCDQIVALLDANRAITGLIQFLLPEQQWSELGAMDKKTMARLADNGAGFSLSSARSLRMNFSEMFNQGVRSIRADCKKFIDKPSVYTDFHTADISSYVNRFDIDLIMTGVAREQHVLTLLDDGITLVQGPYMALPGPVRADLLPPGEALPSPRLASI